MGTRNHGAAVDGRGPNLVGRFKVRIQTPVGIHAGIEDQAEIQRMGQNAVRKFQPKVEKLLLALFVQKRLVLPLETETLVCIPLPLMPTTGWEGNRP